MKKFLSISLILSLLLFAFLGCSADNSADKKLDEMGILTADNIFFEIING